MGMGFQAISSYRASPVFQTLVAQGGPASAVFAFKLAPSGGELYIGGTNSALFNPPISWVSVTKQVSPHRFSLCSDTECHVLQGYWQANMDMVNVGNKAVLQTTSAIIDTGTTLIIGDASGVKKVYNSVPGAKSATSTVGSGFWTGTCTTHFYPVSLIKSPASCSQCLAQQFPRSVSPLGASHSPSRRPSSIWAGFLRRLKTVSAHSSAVLLWTVSEAGLSAMCFFRMCMLFSTLRMSELALHR
jgi:Eukaryotic aspartyl protease